MTLLCPHICDKDESLPRYSQSDVHLSSASKVEGVESHLGGGLTYGLSCQQTHSFTWVTQRTLPLIMQQLAKAEDKNRKLQPAQVSSVPAVSSCSRYMSVKTPLSIFSLELHKESSQFSFTLYLVVLVLRLIRNALLGSFFSIRFSQDSVHPSLTGTVLSGFHITVQKYLDHSSWQPYFPGIWHLFTHSSCKFQADSHVDFERLPALYLFSAALVQICCCALNAALLHNPIWAKLSA